MCVFYFSSVFVFVFLFSLFLGTFGCVHGHWISYLRDENKNEWFRVSDTQKSTITFKDLKSKVIGDENSDETACIFVFDKIV